MNLYNNIHAIKNGKLYFEVTNLITGISFKTFGNNTEHIKKRYTNPKKYYKWNIRRISRVRGIFHRS